MKPKKFSHEPDPTNPKPLPKIEVERKLLPRLKLMGYLLLMISTTTLCFAIFAPKEELIHARASTSSFQNPELASGISLITDDTPFELNPTEVFNFYIVSAIFAAVGASLLFLTWKKKKDHLFVKEAEEE